MTDILLKFGLLLSKYMFIDGRWWRDLNQKIINWMAKYIEGVR